MSEELRRVRDTLIEELRKSETLTVASRALFARYSATDARGPTATSRARGGRRGVRRFLHGPAHLVEPGLPRLPRGGAADRPAAFPAGPPPLAVQYT
jgi:hypothetical protein